MNIPSNIELASAWETIKNDVLPDELSASPASIASPSPPVAPPDSPPQDELTIPTNLDPVPTEDPPEPIATLPFVTLPTEPIRSLVQQTLVQDNPADAVTFIDQLFEQDYENFIGENLTDRQITLESLQDTLKTAESETGQKTAVVYALERKDPWMGKDTLGLLLVLPEGKPFYRTIDIEAKELMRTINHFRTALTDPESQSYLPSAQQLYRWIVEPIASEIERNNVSTLMFATDEGLRHIPLAALHDGKQYLVEKYNLSSIISISLTDIRYQNLQNSRVLAMGASQFPNASRPQKTLPAVPVELSAIANPENWDIADRLPSQTPYSPIWKGQSFLNRQFTLNNLKNQRLQQPFEIVHLATHANFEHRKNAQIELWEGSLDLDEMERAKWYDGRTVELLILSACETAIGDREAEMGFAGLAVRSGVKAALASLWSVGDIATLGLMTEFYQQLRTAPIKASALQQAQIAMIYQRVRVDNGELVNSGNAISLPPQLGHEANLDFSHPYYWAGFTVIGSPW